MPGTLDPTAPAFVQLYEPSGHRSLIVGSKGCSKIGTHESPTVTVHSGPPGMLVASYARFCSSSGCNRADSSSVLLDAIPRPGVGSQHAGWDQGHLEMGPRDKGLRVTKKVAAGRSRAVHPNLLSAPQLPLSPETCSVLPVLSCLDPAQRTLILLPAPRAPFVVTVVP